jgi:hypothetical protein
MWNKQRERSDLSQPHVCPRLGGGPCVLRQASPTARRAVGRDHSVTPVSSARTGLLAAPQAFPPADRGDELLITWLALDRVAASVSAAAPRPALVRLSVLG